MMLHEQKILVYSPIYIFWNSSILLIYIIVQFYSDYTFSCISEVDCASQKATVATSLRMGISMEQSRPSRSATSGRVCIGPLAIGPLKFSIRGRLGIIFRLSIGQQTAPPIFIIFTVRSQCHYKEKLRLPTPFRSSSNNGRRQQNFFFDKTLTMEVPLLVQLV